MALSLSPFCVEFWRRRRKICDCALAISWEESMRLRMRVGLHMLAIFGFLNSASAQSLPGLGNFMGGIAGGVTGGTRGNALVGSFVAGTVNAVMSQILASLTVDEQQKRQQALQQAAREPVGSSTGWTSSETGAAASQTASPPSAYAPPARHASQSNATQAPTAKRATYVNKGQVTNASGQSCSRVMETITMPDGKTGTSESLVCPG